MPRKRKYDSEEDDDDEDEDSFIAHSDEEEQKESQESEEELSPESSPEEYEPKKRSYGTRASKRRKQTPPPQPQQPQQLLPQNITQNLFQSVETIPPPATITPTPFQQLVPMLPQIPNNVLQDNGVLEDGDDDDDAPECNCGDRAVRKTVEKKGRNQGKQFWGCPHFPDGCKYFRWADHAKTTPRKATVSGNRQPMIGNTPDFPSMPLFAMSSSTTMLPTLPNIQREKEAAIHVEHQEEQVYQQQSNISRNNDYHQMRAAMMMKLQQQRLPSRKQTVAEAMGVIPTSDLLVQLHLVDMTDVELKLMLTRLLGKVNREKSETLKQEIVQVIQMRKPNDIQSAATPVK